MSIPDGFFYIKSRLSGKVVDVDGASMKADAKILLWPQKFDSDRDNQLWYYDDGYLVNKKSRKVLDIRGGVIKNNAYICQYDRKTIQNSDNQRFGYRDGFLYCLAKSKMVLDISGRAGFGLDEDGARIIVNLRMLEYQGHDNQLWDLEPAGDERGTTDVLFDADVDEEL